MAEMETEMEKGRQNYQLLYSSAIENGGNLWLVWAIGHNVKMPDLPNHTFPNPTHYVQVHLKSLFSALTRYTDAGLSFFVTFILFNYVHACLL